MSDSVDLNAIRARHAEATRELSINPNIHVEYRIRMQAQQTFLSHDGPALLAEVERLRGVIAQHDLCHDQHGTVGPEDFAHGCAAEQRRIYGCAPHADEVQRLRAALEQIAELMQSARWGGYSAPSDCLLDSDTMRRVQELIDEVLKGA